MEKMCMTPEQEKVLQRHTEELIAFKAEVPHIKDSLDSINKNLTFAEGQSPLRDSVSLLVKNEVAGQQDTCAKNIESVATNVAKSVLDAHEKDLHKRTSNMPKQPMNWESFFKGLTGFATKILPWLIIIGGGGAITVDKLSSDVKEPAAITAPAETGE